jgi:hypothetical protein
MLKTLDRVYVTVRDRLTRSAVERGYTEGHRDGQRAMKAAIMTNLIEKAPLDFKSLELKLGFIYAEGIAKDSKLC